MTVFKPNETNLDHKRILLGVNHSCYVIVNPVNIHSRVLKSCNLEKNKTFAKTYIVLFNQRRTLHTFSVTLVEVSSVDRVFFSRFVLANNENFEVPGQKVICRMKMELEMSEDQMNASRKVYFKHKSYRILNILSQNV